MMTRRRKVDLDPEFWNDPWIQSLSTDDKLLFLWLVTRADHGGFVEWNVNRCAAETSLSPAKASEGLERLMNPYEGFRKVQKASLSAKSGTKVVWLRNYVLVQHGTYNLNVRNHFQMAALKVLRAMIEMFPDIPKVYEGFGDLPKPSETFRRNRKPVEGEGREGGISSSYLKKEGGVGEGNIDDWPHRGEDPAYDQLMENPHVLKPIDWETWVQIRGMYPKAAHLRAVKKALVMGDGSEVRNTRTWVMKRLQEDEADVLAGRKPGPDAEPRVLSDEEWEKSVS